MNSDEAPKKTVSAMKEVIWKVPNYSKTYFTEQKSGVVIKSNTFTVSVACVKTEWFLNLFPNGNIERNKSHISLFLQSASAKEASCDIDFNAKFKFGVVKKNHQKIFLKPECKPSKEDMKTGFGYSKLLSHAELFDENNGYVDDETLTILAELNVEFEVKAQTEVALLSAFSAKIKDDYKKMFENNALADFQLKVSDDKVLKAHKSILAARSPVFYAMLTTDMTESNDGSVDVPDIDSMVMKEVLRFIYYNEVEGLKKIAPKLVFAAEKYQLDELKTVCLEEILSALEVQHVIDSLKIARQISGAEKLYNNCLDFILNNYSTVKQCPSWKDLPNELMTKILDESLERNFSLAI